MDQTLPKVLRLLQNQPHSRQHPEQPMAGSCRWKSVLSVPRDERIRPGTNLECLHKLSDLGAASELRDGSAGGSDARNGTAPAARGLSPQQNLLKTAQQKAKSGAFESNYVYAKSKNTCPI